MKRVRRDGSLIRQNFYSTIPTTLPLLIQIPYSDRIATVCGIIDFYRNLSCSYLSTVAPWPVPTTRALE